MSRTAHRRSAVDRIARTLRPSRRPDVAAGLRLAALLVPELGAVTPDARPVVMTALRDAANAIYPYAAEVSTELLSNPGSEFVNEDDMVCSICDGEPQAVITALRDERDAAYARVDRLTIDLVVARNALSTLRKTTTARMGDDG